MRLRYLNLGLYAPLSGLKICFAHDTVWSALSQGVANPCAIHFVVGLNGSGKSHLLRALASIFLALADGKLPGFPFKLVYELGSDQNPRTVIFSNHSTPAETSIWQGESFYFGRDAAELDFENVIAELGTEAQPHFIARIAPGDYPQAVNDLLPKLLAYTSGSLDVWSEIWASPTALDEQTFRFSEDEDFPVELERPPGWTQQDEDALDKTGGSSELQTNQLHTYFDASDLLNRPILMSKERLDAALLAVALQGLQIERDQGQIPESLTAFFKKAGWHRLVSVRLHLNIRNALTTPRAMRQKIHDALLIAGEVTAIPDPHDRLRVLHFDVNAPLPAHSDYYDKRLSEARSQEEALSLLLGEHHQTAFSRFNELSRWLALGLIDNIEISIRRNEKTDDGGPTDIGIISYADLSDGEQMVLRRWALFHLLEGQQDALLLLDEPETHFNDAWKREIVHFIDQAMGRDFSSVLLASHSAIVLSDVFDEEITHIVKASDGSSTLQKVKKRTFGTDPSALMMGLFETNDSVGVRAQLRIEQFIETISQQKTPTAEQISALKLVISKLGTGFYLSELQVLLREFEKTRDKQQLNTVIMNLESNKLKANLLDFLEQQNSQGNEGDA